MKKTLISLFSLLLFLAVSIDINACGTCGCQNNTEEIKEVNKEITANETKTCSSACKSKKDGTCCKNKKTKTTCNKSQKGSFNFDKSNNYGKTNSCNKGKAKKCCKKKTTEEATTEEATTQE